MNEIKLTWAQFERAMEKIAKQGDEIERLQAELKMTSNDIGEVLDLLIDEKIANWKPGPTEFQAAIDQVFDRYKREHPVLQELDSPEEE